MAKNNNKIIIYLIIGIAALFIFSQFQKTGGMTTNEYNYITNLGITTTTYVGQIVATTTTIPGATTTTLATTTTTLIDNDCVSDCSEVGLSGGTLLVDDQWGNSDCDAWQQQIQLVDQDTTKCCCIKAPFCTDSDAANGVSGDNPWLKGDCMDNTGIHTDNCYTQVRLSEYVCENNQCMRHTQTESNNCYFDGEGLCLDGACLHS